MRHGKLACGVIRHMADKSSAFAKNAVAQTLEIDDLDVHIGRISESVDEKPFGGYGRLFGYDQKRLLFLLYAFLKAC